MKTRTRFAEENFAVTKIILAGLLMACCALDASSAGLPPLLIQRENTNVLLTFHGRLQRAAQVQGPYTNVAGASSPHRVSWTDAPAGFWRAQGISSSSRQRISASGGHSMAIRANGSLWAWGANNDGQLGAGLPTYLFSFDRLGTNLPIQVIAQPNQTWAAVSAGNNHTLAIANDGTLWAWGQGSSGELGNGTYEITNAPVPVAADSNRIWVAVSAGDGHSLALASDGTLWAWGNNSAGQLGDGTFEWRNVPVPVATNLGRTWMDVSAGSGHSLALATDGTLWAWGVNDFGQLGIGLQMGNYSNTNRPAQVAANLNKTWTAISAGEDYSLAVASDGTLWAWGGNGSGQLGDGTFESRNAPVPVARNLNKTWTAISAGGSHSLALASDGALWAWGDNSYGQLGDGTAESQNAPVAVVTNLNTTWAAISAGSYHTLALASDGTLWAWGYNYVGQVGDGIFSTSNPLPLPAATNLNQNWSAISAGDWGHTLALTTDGSLWAWGNNGSGTLGDGNGDRVTLFHAGSYLPVPVATNLNQRWVAFSAGSLNSTAIATDGSLWQWGEMFNGTAGGTITATNQFTPVPVGTNVSKTWAAVSGGFEFTFALATDGTLWAWGHNYYGQLGDGTTNDQFEPVPVATNRNQTWKAVSAGAGTLAIASDGTMWGWGRGPLGDGTTNSSLQPIPVATNSSKTWTMASSSGGHTAAVATDGSLWTWGINYIGQLGDGTTSNRISPVAVATNLNKTWSAVSVGAGHTVALATDGTLWAWGSNSQGQLGAGLPTPAYPLPAFGTNQPVAVGTNLNKTWKAISAGRFFTVALASDGTIWAWGTDEYGQLGIGPWKQLSGGAVWGLPPSD